MPSSIKPVTKGQWLLTIQGLDFYWETFSGLKDRTQTSDYSDGLTNRLYKLHGPRVMEDMTFTKAFDPVKDKPIVKYWKDFCQAENNATTASVTPIKYCPTPEPIGPALILYGVTPIAFEGFEVDKKSNEVEPLTLIITAEEWNYD